MYAFEVRENLSIRLVTAHSSSPDNDLMKPDLAVVKSILVPIAAVVAIPSPRAAITAINATVCSPPAGEERRELERVREGAPPIRKISKEAP